MTPILKVCTGPEHIEIIDVRGGTLARFPSVPAGARLALEVFAGSIADSVVAITTKVLWLLNSVLAASNAVDVVFIGWNRAWPTVSVQHFILGWQWEHVGIDSNEGLDSLHVVIRLQDVPAAREALAAIIAAPFQWNILGVSLNLGLSCGGETWTLERSAGQNPDSPQFWGEWRKL